MSSLKDAQGSGGSQSDVIRVTDGRAYKVPRDPESGFPLVRIREHYHGFPDLVVTDAVMDRLENLVLENRSAAKLAAYGLAPKNKLLFCGPPGTGKTLSAKIISSAIGYPLAHVEFDSVVSSYLGGTAVNIRKIFDFVEKHKFVVLFDEFDMVGKSRDDPQEHGEIRRLVNNFMQMLDGLGNNSIIITTTNHHRLLDKAVWRRFDDVIYFDMPDFKRRVLLFEKYLRVMRRDGSIAMDQLARKTRNYSAADIAMVCKEALRRSITGNCKIVTKDHVTWAIMQQELRKKTISHES